MRVLAIDAGNSRIKWGFAQDGAWTALGAIETARAAELSQALGSSEAPDRIVVANVAGIGAATAIEGALSRFDVAPRIVVAQPEQCGVRSSYAVPHQLGPDRWAALIAARDLYDGPCVVANAGTTMTVDALSGDGVFLGGFIVAGYSIMRASLATNTDRLALQEGRFGFFPDNTGDAIASGALNALAGAVERMVRYMADAGESDPVVLLSGGDAETIAPLLNASTQVVDNLVLQGLLRIALSNV